MIEVSILSFEPLTVAMPEVEMFKELAEMWLIMQNTLDEHGALL